MNKDYGRHILRTWVDTHKKSIRADPEIYQSGEIDTKAADSESEDDHDATEDEAEDDSKDDDEYVDEDELANIYIGMKRKAPTATRSGFTNKVARTLAQPITAPRVIDDHHRADLTLIDTPVDEEVLTHPYGRHGCLYVEVKFEANKKPNPLKAVSGPLLEIPYYY